MGQGQLRIRQIARTNQSWLGNATAVLLPRDELKAELVRRGAEQRGVDPAAERARLKAMNATLWSEGRTKRQRVGSRKAAA